MTSRAASTPSEQVVTLGTLIDLIRTANRATFMPGHNGRFEMNLLDAAEDRVRNPWAGQGRPAVFREAISTLLASEPSLTAGEVARRLGCSYSTAKRGCRAIRSKS